MLSFKCRVPPDLLDIQRWFASIITRPIDSDSQMLVHSPSGRPMSEETAEIILPSAKLSSLQRMQIYNQQYWWRLLSILHENFPTLTRLFGYSDFNLSIGIPYLTIYPSDHWSLSKLGDQLVHWLKKYYTAPDKALVVHAAELDLAYQEVFFASDPEDLTPSIDLLSKKVQIQNHVKLFKLPYDLFSFRSDFLKEKVEFWSQADFPSLPKCKTYFFILLRNTQNFVTYSEIEEGEWNLLHSITAGISIEKSCDLLEKQGGLPYVQAQESLANWIQKWIQEKWISVKEV